MQQGLMNKFFQDHDTSSYGGIPPQSYYAPDGQHQQVNLMRSLHHVDHHGLLLQNTPSYEAHMPSGAMIAQQLLHSGLQEMPSSWTSQQGQHHVDGSCQFGMLADRESCQLNNSRGEPRIAPAQAPQSARVVHQQFAPEMMAPPGNFGDLFSTAVRNTGCIAQQHFDWHDDSVIARQSSGGLVYAGAAYDQKGIGGACRNLKKVNHEGKGGKKGREGKATQQLFMQDAEMYEDTRQVSLTSPQGKLAPADSQPGSALMECQCHLKMLIPNHIAGAIIGREGVQIGEILLRTRTQMQISACDDFFPGTYDRILIMGGNMHDLEDCIKMVLKQFREVMDPIKNGRDDRAFLCKAVVPSSSVSGLIGHCGDNVKKLSEKTGCRINMSPRVKDMQERIVLIYGDFECLIKATIFIAKEIQSDPHLKEHLALKYDVKVPLGAWSGDKAAPAQPSAPLIPPHDAEFYSKRELILYLQSAAPREILLRHSLLGKIENTMKSKGVVDLKRALQETWDFRTMEMGEEAVSVRERPPAPNLQPQQLMLHEVTMPLPPGEVKRSVLAQPASSPIAPDRQQLQALSTITARKDENTAERSGSSAGNSQLWAHDRNAWIQSEEVVELQFVDITNRDMCDSPSFEFTDLDRDTSIDSLPRVNVALPGLASAADCFGTESTATRARSLSSGRKRCGSSRRIFSAQGRLFGFNDFDQTLQFGTKLQAQRDQELKDCLSAPGTAQLELEDGKQNSDLVISVFQTNRDEEISIEYEQAPEMPTPEIEHPEQDSYPSWQGIERMIISGSQNLERHFTPMSESAVEACFTLQNTALGSSRISLPTSAETNPQSQNAELEHDLHDRPEIQAPRIGWPPQEEREQVIVGAGTLSESSSSEDENQVGRGRRYSPSMVGTVLRVYHGDTYPERMHNEPPRSSQVNEQRSRGVMPIRLDNKRGHDTTWFDCMRNTISPWLPMVADGDQAGRYCSAAPVPCSWWSRKIPLRRVPGFPESDSEESSTMDV